MKGLVAVVEKKLDNANGVVPAALTSEKEFESVHSSAEHITTSIKSFAGSVTNCVNCKLIIRLEANL